MTADSKSILDIFGRNKDIQVPYFQRIYVWDTPEWDRLWEDMSNVALNPHIYFLGSVILKGNLTQTIIDGQQRVTTMLLLLKALSIRCDKKDLFYSSYFKGGSNQNDPVFTHNKHDRPIFEEILKLDTFTSPMHSSGRILDAWNFFCEKIKTLDPYQADRMMSQIERCVRLVAIVLDSDDDEQQIFDTINSLGVQLTTGDLLKNYFFDKNNESVYTTLWAPVFERANSNYWTESLTKGRNKESNIEQFFYALLQIVAWNQKSGVEAADKKAYRLKDKVFNSYKDYFKKQNIVNNKDPFIALTVDYAKSYQSTFNKSVLKQRVALSPDVKRLVLIMYARKMMGLIPFILFILHEQRDENEQKRIFGYLESYLIRRIICGSSSGNYADLFSENLIGQNKITYLDIKKYIEEKDSDASLAMPTDQNIHDHIANQNVSKDATLLLYLLEGMTQGSNITLDGLSNYTAEQLLPSKHDLTAWPLSAGETEEDRKIKLQTLGNYVLIGGNEKLSAKQHINWSVESSALKNGCQGLSDELHPLSSIKWDSEQIESQNNVLADMICKYWPSSGISTQDSGLVTIVEEPISNPIVSEDFTEEDIKASLPFGEEDFTITDLVHHTIGQVSFDDFIKEESSSAANLGIALKSINEKYKQDLSGCYKLTEERLAEELGKDYTEDLKNRHPLFYIGNSAKGWVVTLDRTHFIRQREGLTLMDLVRLAEEYTTPDIKGLWDLIKKDSVIKGIIQEKGMSQYLGISEKVCNDAADCLNKFIGDINITYFVDHPKNATDFDALRRSISFVLELRSRSKYIERHPYLVRMIFDIVDFIEDHYLETGDINIAFKATKHKSKVRITFLETGEAPLELTYNAAIKVLCAKYVNELRSMTLDGTTNLVVCSPSCPGPYDDLKNGWWSYKVDSRKAGKTLNMMLARLRGKVSLEF